MQKPESKELSNEEKVAQARLKLAEKFGESSRVGGKGTERRKKKTVHKTQLNDDKKLKTILKKYNLHPLPEIGEVNMFKDDNTVIQFKNPEVLASLPSNTFVVIGKNDTKAIKDVLPEVLTHLGPKQLGALRDLTKGRKTEEIKEAVGEEEEDVPNLVNQNFEKAAEK